VKEMSQSKIRSYRDLTVWQRSKAFAVEIYRVTRSFPREEQYSLTDQIRRAAVSVPSNIAEGHIRQSDKVFANHLDVALGSSAELDTQLEIALDVGYLKPEIYKTLVAELQEIMKMLRGLLKAVKR
jgi:four helix bundle protein